MKASSKTLGQMLALIPLTLQRRYDPNVFGVAAANEVMADVERQCDPDFFTGESGILLLEGVTDYALPDSVRQVKGLYVVPAGDLGPDRNHPVVHQVLGSKIRLEQAPTLDEEEDISGTVSVSPPSDKTKVYNTSLLGSSLEEDELVSRLLRVTHANGTVEYRILKGNTPDDSTADINGELDALAAAGDAFLITSNFLLVEHTRYLGRLTSGSTSGIISLPQDCEYLMRAGLTFKYHAQADSLSKETAFWRGEYQSELLKFSIDTTKARGTSTRNAPRSLPSMFN